MAEQEDNQELDTSVLDRILHRTSDETTPVEVEDGGCINCANQGLVSKLKDGECPTCGFKTNPNV